MTTSAEERLRETIRFLIQAIERYLDNPGCNIPARNTALAKLRWATEEGRKVLTN